MTRTIQRSLSVQCRPSSAIYLFCNIPFFKAIYPFSDISFCQQYTVISAICPLSALYLLSAIYLFSAVYPFSAVYLLSTIYNYFSNIPLSAFYLSAVYLFSAVYSFSAIYNYFSNIPFFSIIPFFSNLPFSAIRVLFRLKVLVYWNLRCNSVWVFFLGMSVFQFCIHWQITSFHGGCCSSCTPSPAHSSLKFFILKSINVGISPLSSPSTFVKKNGQKSPIKTWTKSV